MSRIFDALQRSGTEQSGIEYPDLVSVVTEVFESPHGARPVAVPRADAATVIEPAAAPAAAASSAVDAATVPPAASANDALRAAAVELLRSETGNGEARSGEPGNGDPRNRAASHPSSLDFPALAVRVAAGSRLVFLTEPDSLAAEKFRFLGVRLRQLQQNRPLKKVLVTSTIPEEGKSTVSANLAGVLARRKQTVLLIEGDLRRPTLSQQFGLGRLAGLGEWLQSSRQAVSNIYRLEGPDFWFLPAGNPPENPLELLQSGRLSYLMAQLAQLFDWIVVDSPPLLPLADTTVWSRVTDGTLLVAREGKSEKKQLERGVDVLKKSDLLGVVLNGCAHPDHTSYYQRYAPSAK